MKIRNGFVSNSSSSSFLINIRELKFKPTGKIKRVYYPKGIKIRGKRSFTLPDMKQVSTPLLVTKGQLKALKKRGYKFCEHTYASRLQEGCKAEEKPANLATHMYYEVVCNEADEIEYLVRHGIPFEASTHYGHYSVFMKKDGKRVTIARNLGREMETYKSLDLDDLKEPMLRHQTVESILKEGWNK